MNQKPEPKTVPETGTETDHQYEALRKEALENYESWGQWMIEPLTKYEVYVLIKKDGVNKTRESFKAIESYHQDVRGAGGFNDEE